MGPGVGGVQVHHSARDGGRSALFLVMGSLLGDSGGVVNSLDFCPASLKSLCCIYFRCILSLQWKAVTVNLRILHCQL